MSDDKRVFQVIHSLITDQCVSASVSVWARRGTRQARRVEASPIDLANFHVSLRGPANVSTWVFWSRRVGVSWMMVGMGLRSPGSRMRVPQASRQDTDCCSVLHNVHSLTLSLFCQTARSFTGYLTRLLSNLNRAERSSSVSSWLGALFLFSLRG